MAFSSTSFIQQENARLKVDNETLQAELRALREFVRILNDLAESSSKFQSDSELLPLLNDILKKALNLLNAPDGSLLLLDEEQNELVFVIVHGAIAADLSGFRIPANQGIAGWVVQNGSSCLVRDVKRDARFSHMVDEEFKFRTQSITAAPIIGDGKVYGLIEALNQPGDEPFSENDLALLRLLCRAAGEALADIERTHPVEA
jgi:GAF domain-containing protein